ncbi:hypothetical protein [Actinophytocola oryzae]|uniref:CU044_5270 family protein n=1 Tax=Actinophytocola oryzae TaxID=502181 RepID=A0A4R7VVZ4_9PSEU|nr:hypothetical protein [Actinophytocola oryzae]TDV54206.1 hypothetical protein CLV71_104677 [Actinophytocola oryzae]
MNTDLEKNVAEALRSRAAAVPTSPMPPLGAATAPVRTRRAWLVPVAAAAVVVLGVAAAVVLINPGGDAPPPSPGRVISADEGEQGGLAPGEVYYSLHLTTDASRVIIERELWLPQDRTAAWSQKVVMGRTLEDGRVVPDVGPTEAPPGGECYPATQPGDNEWCTKPGSWFSPTVEFLASAPRDQATIKQQLRDAAVAEQRKRTLPDGDFTATGDTMSESNLTFLELNYLRILLATDGVPSDLSSVLRGLIAAMPGIEVTADMADLTGRHGTGYSLYDRKHRPLTVIFDARDRFLGSPTEAVHHGVAPALGAPPSRMFD